MLIELLVVITVLGLVAAPLLNNFIAGYSSLAVAGDKTRALNLARHEMEQVKSMGYPAAYTFYVEQENSPRVKVGPPYLETRVEPEHIYLLGAGSGEPLLLELLKIKVCVYQGEPGERAIELVSCLSRR
ncbi:MAG: type II secretion system protein [Firmicutes bacterium]|nr:type II secretion system protein [Bacillota bacterium]